MGDKQKELTDKIQKESIAGQIAAKRKAKEKALKAIFDDNSTGRYSSGNTDK